LNDNYNLFTNNCECLVVWCKTGRWESKQVESRLSKIVDGIGSLLKHLLSAFALPQIIISTGQEAVSELLENAIPSFAHIFTNNLALEGITGAIAAILVEFILLLWKLYKVKEGKMTWKQFRRETLRSMISRSFVLVLSVLLEALLISVGIPVLGGFVGAIVGSLIGDYVANKLCPEEKDKEGVEEVESFNLSYTKLELQPCTTGFEPVARFATVLT